MANHETEMNVVLASNLKGAQVSVHQNSAGKFTSSLIKNASPPIDESLIGKGVSTNNPTDIIPLLGGISIESSTAEITFSDGEESSKKLFGIESIIGDDDRKLVINTKVWPWSVHGALMSTFPNGKSTLGTGTLVNRHHVITAGHNVYRPKLGGWAIGCKFIPGWNVSPGVTVPDQTPFGETNGSRFLSTRGWTQDLKREYDYAMVILDRDIGEETGWYGLAYLESDILLQHFVNISGYPANKGGDSLFTHSEKVSSVSERQIGYPTDTTKGQSGSGVWVYHSAYVEEPKVVAIHNYGDVDEFEENISTRINESVFNNLIQWMGSW